VSFLSLTTRFTKPPSYTILVLVTRFIPAQAAFTIWRTVDKKNPLGA